MGFIHEERYTRGYVTLEDYETGLKIGPLPRAQAYAQLRAHGYDVGKKVQHSTVEQTLKRKGYQVAPTNKRGGIHPRNYLGGRLARKRSRSDLTLGGLL